MAADLVRYRRSKPEDDLGEDGGSVTDSNDEADDKAALVIEDDITNKEKKRKRWESFKECLGCTNIRGCIRNSWKAILIGLVFLVLALVLALVITLVAREPHPPKYNAGVSADTYTCSKMAGNIMESGGTAVDAAITAMLCIGLVVPESSGIGGGGFMVVYNTTNQSALSIDFREVAPSLSSVDMFRGNASLSIVGGLAVGVPGELAGMKKAHDLYGRLPWKQLFEPVIKLANEGFPMTPHTERAVARTSSLFRSDSLFFKWFYHEDRTPKVAGDMIKRPEFGKALRAIADNGIDVFYNGSIAQEIVQTVKDNNGILTLEDLITYKPLVQDPVSLNISNMLFYTMPLPSSGSILLFMLRVLSMSPNIGNNNVTWQRVIETFKYGFGIRSTLGDPWCNECDNYDDILNNLLNKKFAQYINNSITDTSTYNVSHYNTSDINIDHGTSHLNVIDPDGLAVAVTTSVNTYFGSTLITPNTGIVLNNDMDDFSSPNVTNYFEFVPSKANFIKPGKRAMSSMSPVIVVDRDSQGNKFVKLISGGAGGSRIITANLQAIFRVLYLHESIQEAVEAKRLHHQLLPNVVHYERGYPQSILDYLESVGHAIRVDDSLAIINQIINSSGNVMAHSDCRKGCEAYVTHI